MPAITLGDATEVSGECGCGHSTRGKKSRNTEQSRPTPMLSYTQHSAKKALQWLAKALADRDIGWSL